jgi:DNA-binding PadR family transcriptional regulator
MNLSVLDAFILSLLDRGLETPYDLQRQGGLSLGASSPSLQRLVKANLVKRGEGASATNRPRHQYQLTAIGKREAQTAWKPFLDDNDSPSDIDSILRIADMAKTYRAEKQKIRSFLTRAANKKSQLAQHADLSSTGTHSGDRILYMSMRAHCDAARLHAEADTLVKLARIFRPKGEVDGQTSLL